MNKISYSTENYDVDIDINLNNGVYAFTPDSGTGKTFLYKKLVEYNRLGEPVYAISYNDFISSGFNMNKAKHSKVIMIDRYDMYIGELDDLIKELGNSSIVLVNINKLSLMMDVCIDYCIIKLRYNKIEIY